MYGNFKSFVADFQDRPTSRINYQIDRFIHKFHIHNMANSKYAYVRDFELPDPLLPGTFMLFRLDGHSFHRCGRQGKIYVISSKILDQVLG